MYGWAHVVIPKRKHVEVHVVDVWGLSALKWKHKKTDEEIRQILAKESKSWRAAEHIVSSVEEAMKLGADKTVVLDLVKED